LDELTHCIAVFTGTEKSEQITMWDVRARSAVYELATGNNAVESMVWDSKHNSLYAATQCDYIDRHGGHHGYRRAKIPKSTVLKAERQVMRVGGKNIDSNGDEDDVDVDDDDEAEDEDDEYDDDDNDKAWPQDAFHNEDYFGYTFDAGEHRTCESLQILIPSGSLSD
jgi:hypothetical protein